MLELARQCDFDSVNALAIQVHALHVSWRPDIYQMSERMYSAERFSDAVRQRQLYVAKLNELVVGYTRVQILDYNHTGVVRRKVMYIDEFVVSESCRNQGIGTQMMAEVRALAKAFGCTDLELGVYPQNDAAVAFYQKCGFAIRSIDMQRRV